MIVALIFLFWEYLFQIFGILSLQCGVGPNLLRVTVIPCKPYSLLLPPQKQASL
jgi:hypothetical protein